MNAKTISETRSIISDMMLPSHANPSGIVHGGVVMKMMDTCAGVAATRHAKSNTVTVRVDEMIFYHPIFVGQLVVCEAELVYVGKTSMEIKVEVKVEDMKTETPEKLALTAFFTFVALDESGKPREVPRLKIETYKEAKAFELGKARYLLHK